jgi:hypothetical protein
MGQSASFILAPLLWAQCLRESSNAPALKGSLLWVRKVQDKESCQAPGAPNVRATRSDGKRASMATDPALTDPFMLKWQCLNHECKHIWLA